MNFYFFFVFFTIFFLFYIISNLFGNFIPIVGASAGISAIILATAIFTPYYRIFLFGVLEIELRWIVAIKVFLDFLGMFGGPNSGGNQAHIGGYLFGLLYILNLKGIWNFPTNWIPKKTSKPKRSANVQINRQSPSQDEIDKILDKISKSGFDSWCKECRASYRSETRRYTQRIMLWDDCHYKRRRMSKETRNVPRIQQTFYKSLS